MDGIITLFPPAEDVFEDPERAGGYLLPLATVDGSTIDADLPGPLHFVVPIDPYDGVVGEYTGAFHTATCTANWVGFGVANGRYRLDAEYEFFERLYYRDHPVPDTIHESVRGRWIDDVAAHYEKTTKAYDDFVQPLRSGATGDDEVGLRFSLGGPPMDLNWSNMGNFALDHVESAETGERHPYPLTADGRRYRYIGMVAPTSGAVRRFLRCDTLLFFDPESQTALVTFDW